MLRLGNDEKDSKEIVKKNSKKGVNLSNYQHFNKGGSLEVCRMCENVTKVETIRGGIINNKLHIFKKSMIPLLSNENLQGNYQIFNIPESENHIILPCMCLIPVHIKCLLRLILISQNLKCENCGSCFILKKSKKISFFRKIINTKFLFYNLFFVFLIILCVISIYYTLAHTFEDKFFHLKYIITIILCLFIFVLIIFFSLYLKQIKEIPLSESLNFEDNNNVSSEIGYNALESQGRLNTKVNNINHILINNGINAIQSINNDVLDHRSKTIKIISKKSAKILSAFLKVNFDIFRNDIVEYRVEKTFRLKIDNYYKQGVLDLIFELNEKVNYEILQTKLKDKRYVNIINNQFTQSYLDILEKNPDMLQRFSEDEVNKQNLKNSTGPGVDNKIEMIPKESSKSNKKDSHLKIQLIGPEEINITNKDNINKSPSVISVLTINGVVPVTSAPNSNFLLEKNADVIQNTPGNNFKKNEIHLKYAMGVPKIDEMDSFQGSNEDDISPFNRKRQMGKHVRSGSNFNTVSRTNSINNNPGQIIMFGNPDPDNNEPPKFSLLTQKNSIRTPANGSYVNIKQYIKLKTQDSIDNFAGEVDIRNQQYDNMVVERQKENKGEIIKLKDNLDSLSPIVDTRNLQTTISNIGIFENSQLTQSTHTMNRLTNYHPTQSIKLSPSKFRMKSSENISIPEETEYDMDLKFRYTPTNLGEKKINVEKFQRSSKKMKSNRLQSVDKLKNLLLNPSKLSDDSSKYPRSTSPNPGSNSKKNSGDGHEVINNIKKYNITNLVINTDSGSRTNLILPYSDCSDRISLEKIISQNKNYNEKNCDNSPFHNQQTTLNVNVNFITNK